eukprot:m.48881 g.48881  ORF g.48881 m.48881 type:complete len:105 (+) comp7049_c0_seq1:86-400(+)
MGALPWVCLATCFPPFDSHLKDVLRCKKLVARGEDVNEALHYAIGRGRLEIVTVFIQAGADLHTAIKLGDYYQPAPGEGGDSGGGGKKKSKKKGKKSGKKKSKK